MIHQEKLTTFTWPLPCWGQLLEPFWALITTGSRTSWQLVGWRILTGEKLAIVVGGCNELQRALMPCDVGPVLLPVSVLINWFRVIAQVLTMPPVICALYSADPPSPLTLPVVQVCDPVSNAGS